MSLNRLEIMTAVEERLTTACPSLAFVTREPKDFRQTTKFPAALLLGGPETADRDPHMPPVWTLSPSIHVYAKSSKEAAPDEQLDSLAREIEAAFERQDGEDVADEWQTTLGGLVTRCWVSDTTRAQGVEEAEVSIGLEILVPGT